MNLRMNVLPLDREMAGYDQAFGGTGRTAKEGVSEQMADLGLHFHNSHLISCREYKLKLI